MGHNANTNYTVSQSITTEFNGDSVVLGTLPNQAGNGSVILTITPNSGYTVNASDFTIGGITADSTYMTLSSTVTNPATGNYLSVVNYKYTAPSAGGSNTALPNQVQNVTMFNSEFDYDSTASTYVPVTPNNVVYVHVFFENNFVMPSMNLTLNIDIDGSANITNAIQYPAVWETWTGPTGSGYYTITVVGNPLLNAMSLAQSTNNATALNNISGLVDDGVRTLLMTKTLTAASGRYFTSITETEWFTAYGLADWLPYFEANITSQVYNTNSEETERVIEYYYTNPPVGNPQGLDPTFGGNTYGLGFLFDYIVGTQATVYPLTGGGTGGVAPLAPPPPFNNIVNTTSSAELGGEVEDINPPITSIPSTEFFGQVTNVVMDTSREISAITGETRSVTIYGSVGALYYITVSNGSNTYDDSSDTFTSGATQIDGEIGSGGSTIHNIVFPVVASNASYVLTIGSRFGTSIPENLGDGTSGNIGTIASTATKTFTIAFASASDISESMPSSIVLNFAELTGENASTEWKASIDGDAGEEFAVVSETDVAAVAAMSVTSGSASGWEWGLTNFKITVNGVNPETNKDNLTVGGTLTVQTVGGASVQYTIALDSLTNVS